jgi:hypothetical protein
MASSWQNEVELSLVDALGGGIPGQLLTHC